MSELHRQPLFEVTPVSGDPVHARNIEDTIALDMAAYDALSPEEQRIAYERSLRAGQVATGAVSKLESTVNQQSAKNVQLGETASRDSLTGLFNRRGLEEAFGSRVFSNEKPSAAIQLDLDGFKQVNDTKGHEEGDKVLRSVSRMLERVLRADDIIARPGGDEIVILLPGASDEKVVKRIIENIQDGTSNLNTLENGWNIGLSGGATVVKPGTDFETAMRPGDALLYEAKRQGKGRVIFEDSAGNTHTMLPTPVAPHHDRRES